MKPDKVHFGQADAIRAARQATLAIAFSENAERIVNNPAILPDKFTAAWINPPTPKRLA